MAKYLDAELKRLVKEVVKAEIPRDQRAAPKRRARTTQSRSNGRAASSSGTRAATKSSRTRATASSSRSRSARARKS